jgi:hypothetical protein
VGLIKPLETLKEVVRRLEPVIPRLLAGARSVR